MDSSAEAMRTHIEQISDTLTQIFERADNAKLPTYLVANEIAEERLLQQ